MNSIVLTLLLALLLPLVASVSAAPRMLYDASEGASQPIDPYLRVLRKSAQFVLPDDPATRSKIQQDLLAIGRKHGGYSGVHVPIRTSNLVPGRTTTRDAYFPNLAMPLFVVGADPLSLAWLKQWRTALVKVGAVGWVVQAENEQELRAVAEAGAGLRFMAAPGNALTGVFGIEVYPVLISERAIEQ